MYNKFNYVSYTREKPKLITANQQLWDQWTLPINEIGQDIELNWKNDDGNLSQAAFNNSLGSLTTDVIDRLVSHFFVGANVTVWKENNLKPIEGNYDDWAYPEWMGGSSEDLTNKLFDDDENASQQLYKLAKEHINNQVSNGFSLSIVMPETIGQVAITKIYHIIKDAPKIINFANFCRDYMSGFDANVREIFKSNGLPVTPDDELLLENIQDVFDGITDIVGRIVGSGYVIEGKMASSILKYIVSHSLEYQNTLAEYLDDLFIFDGLKEELAKLFEKLCAIPDDIRDAYLNAQNKQQEIFDEQNSLNDELKELNIELEGDQTAQLIQSKKDWIKVYNDNYFDFLGIKENMKFDAGKYYEQTVKHYQELWMVLKFKINFYQLESSQNEFNLELEMFDKINGTIENEEQ